MAQKLCILSSSLILRRDIPTPYTYKPTHKHTSFAGPSDARGAVVLCGSSCSIAPPACRNINSINSSSCIVTASSKSLRRFVPYKLERGTTENKKEGSTQDVMSRDRIILKNHEQLIANEKVGKVKRIIEHRRRVLSNASQRWIEQMPSVMGTQCWKDFCFHFICLIHNTFSSERVVNFPTRIILKIKSI